MMNYKLLIVDDEELIRQGLRTRLEYLRFPNLQILEAGSGQEALDCFAREDIAIALVDISMPDITGLEMIAQAKQMGARTQFILLSGYSEFEYAQQGIRLGVRAYLNKPVSNDELKEQIESALWTLKEDSQASNQSAWNPEREFNLMLSGAVRAADVKQAFLGLRAHWPELFGGAGRMYLCLLHIGRKDSEDGLLTMDQLDRLRGAAREILLGMRSQCRILPVNSYQNAQRVWALFLDAKDGFGLKAEVEQMFLSLRQGMERQANISITMGVSRIAGALSYECAAEARAALRQRKLYGRSNIYFYEDIAAFETQPFPEAELELLRRHMVRGDRAGVRRQLERLFAQDSVGARKVEYLHVLWVRVVGLMLSAFESIDTATTNLLLSHLARGDSVTDRAESLRTLIDLADACLKRSDEGDDVSHKVRLALDYMRERFNEDIVMNDLAARLDMSPTYFSSIFKREVGMSAMQYVTTLRIERAKEYLANTDESVAAIAKKTGYEGSQYFFRVFKKMTGMTPLVYRQEAQGKREER